MEMQKGSYIKIFRSLVLADILCLDETFDVPQRCLYMMRLESSASDMQLACLMSAYYNLCQAQDYAKFSPVEGHRSGCRKW
jgi:hypothetical protein